MISLLQGQKQRIAFIGSYVPRQCGIATFTSDLVEAIAAHTNHECLVVAMSDEVGRYEYPERVAFEIDQREIESYRECARNLKKAGVTSICVQHEYGIYGGEAGDYLMELLDRVDVPVIATLHTILENPNPAQRRSLDRLAARCAKLVVMSERGAQMLNRVHGIPLSKIEHVHHGVPEIEAGSGEKWREKLGIGDAKTLLTFGLLSPDKGIENVIAAMPAIVRECPNAVYIVVGATHPHIRAQRGEVYRESLESLAKELGVSDKVIFYNRFVDLGELTAFLDLADIYVTPYLKQEQITSGTLAYAMGSGKAIISTPYWYAEELLANNRGILVPCRSAQAIAEAAVSLLTDDARRLEIKANASKLGSTMKWSAIADRYANILASTVLVEEPAAVMLPKPTPETPTIQKATISLEHLCQMTDDCGLLQHAIGTFPNYAEGYCIDDNARALLLTCNIRRHDVPVDPLLLDRLEAKYLAFIFHAFNSDYGRFRNFMNYSRQWLEDFGSEDSHGRTIWALAAMARRKDNRVRADRAEELLFAALPAVRDFTSPRAWAYTLLGLDEAVRNNFDNPYIEAIGEDLANRLYTLLKDNAAPDWPWFEPVLSYANARLPEALLISAQWQENIEMLEAALSSLAWLADLQIGEDGLFEPVGCHRVMKRTEAKPIFDQQPLEAYASASAYMRAWRVTRDPSWLRNAHAAASWFLGRNLHRKPLFDIETGACADGLTELGLNENCGAESTLCGLSTMVEMAAEIQPAGRNPVVNSSAKQPIEL